MSNKLKRILAVVSAAAILVTSLTTSIIAGAASGSTYYVSVKSGSDKNNGSKNAPFKTIQKAADVVQPGDTVIIEGGEYRETVIMNLAENIPGYNPDDEEHITGYEDKPVLFKAKSEKPEDEVIITGVEDITGTWTKLNGFTSPSGTVEGDVYKIKTDMPLGENSQIFSNGRMQFLAQWPERAKNSKDLNKENMSDLLMAPVFSRTQGGSGSTKVVDDKLPKGIDLSGAVLNYKGSANWSGWMGKITSNTDGSFEFINSAPSGDEAVKSGKEYYVSNSLDLLNIPGEWYYDNNAGELYLCVEKGRNPKDLKVQKKVNNLALSIENSSYVTFENIDVFGANLKFDSSASNCTIDGMKAFYLNHGLYNNAANALYLNGTNNAIWNSEIAYAFTGGITTYGSGNKVINCHIHDMDYSISGASTISMWGGNEVIYRNTMHSVPRSMIGGSARRVRIAYNHLYDNGKLTKDCGMIYYGTNDGGNLEVDHNILHNNQTPDNAMGLYMDCGTSNILMHHNVVYDIDVYGLSANVPGHMLRMFNNTVYDSQGSMNDWGWAKIDEYSKDQNGTYFLNNIIAYNHKKEGGHPVKIFTLTDVAVAKTNIATPENENPTDLFNDVSYANNPNRGITLPSEVDLTLRDMGDNATERNLLAREGGTPIRGLIEKDNAYLGAYNPEKKKWTAGCTTDAEDGHGDPTVTPNKLDRNQKIFKDANGDIEIDLENPINDIQYENKVTNAAFEGGLDGWTKEWDKSAGIIVSKTDAMTYGSGRNAPAGKEDTRSAKQALKLGYGMDGVSRLTGQCKQGFEPTGGYSCFEGKVRRGSGV